MMAALVVALSMGSLTRRAVVLGGTPLVAAAMVPPAVAASPVREGMAAFVENDVERSIALFDKAIAERPESKPYLWQRGLSLYYVERFGEGAEQFAIDVSVNPNDTEEQIVQGREPNEPWARWRRSRIRAPRVPLAPLPHSLACADGAAFAPVPCSGICSAWRASRAAWRRRVRTSYASDATAGLSCAPPRSCLLARVPPARHRSSSSPRAPMQPTRSVSLRRRATHGRERAPQASEALTTADTACAIESRCRQTARSTSDYTAKPTATWRVPGATSRLRRRRDTGAAPATTWPPSHACTCSDEVGDMVRVYCSEPIRDRAATTGLSHSRLVWALGSMYASCRLQPDRPMPAPPPHVRRGPCMGHRFRRDALRTRLTCTRGHIWTMVC